MPPEDLCFMTAAELAPLIEARKLSPVELVEAQLARIEAQDGVLRAFICVDAAGARAAAKAAEIEIAAGGYRGPLHGVTVAHKDIIDVRGLPTTAASKLMDGYVAPEDATVAARLRAAGAVCLGKLNLIEFASGSMGLYGIARNPFNLAAGPGGSSSGSGVAVAAGLTTLATGTDTGGSVRHPASFCGLAGLRPTYGRVSRHGCVPLGWSQDTIGPMARTAVDAALMLSVMAGPDRRDATASTRPPPDYAAGIDASLGGLRVGIDDGFFMADLDPEVEAALREAIAVLQTLGAEVRRVSLQASEYASSASWVIAYSEAFALHHERFAARCRDYTPAFYHKITAAGLTSAEEYILSQQVRQAVTREFHAVMRDVDVILTPASRTKPPMAGAPPPAGRSLRWPAEMTSVTRPASLSGYPALSIPIGVTAENTPIGMQLIGRPWEEATLLRAAHAYERATSFAQRRPPPFPETIPPAFGSQPSPPRTEGDTGAVAPGWVVDAARLLGYGFVSEADAAPIAAMLAPVKAQLAAAKGALHLDLEPPTRPAGAF